MRLVLGTFACSGIKALQGGDVAAVVEAALCHYTRGKGSSSRRPKMLPSFLAEPSVGHPGTNLELSVDPEIQAALEREARESDGVSIEQIATHAVLVYLADLDEALGRETFPLTQQV